MSHTLVIRGFDHDTHTQLGNLSRQKKVSVNSIVKDAVDQWLKKQNEIPKRHHLLLYDPYHLSSLHEVPFKIHVAGSKRVENHTTSTELGLVFLELGAILAPDQKEVMEYVWISEARRSLLRARF